MKKEISLYIHIPFCIKKCLYCDFLSFSDFSLVKAYINALINEISVFKTDSVVKSIFIGGGTPSAIEAEYIAEIMNCIQSHFKLKENAEITIEANPGTLTREKALIYKDCGINRISMGLQAWQNHLLKILGRIHTKEDFLKSFCLAEKYFNTNVDLMFALPQQTMEEWVETLGCVMELEPKHISAYSLIVEEGTPFYHMYQAPPCSDELDRQMYYKAKEMLADKGYIHYEISNFAKQGYESVHNLTYWQRGEYKGFGLGAASLVGNERLKNIENLRDYISGLTVAEREVLSQNDEISEFMFLGLRCIKGISISEFKNTFNKSIYDIYSQQLQKLCNEKLIEINNDNIYLTEKGIDLSNMVFTEFI